MEINRNNYESFFLDYIENRLSEDELDALHLFLEQNPDLLQQLKDYEPVFLSKENSTTFEEKEFLKKGADSQTKKIDQHNYKQYFIRYHEGALSSKEIAELESFVGDNDALQRELKLFGHTFLQTDNAIEFDDKRSLKKSTTPVAILYPAIAVAAAMLLFLGLEFLFVETTAERIQPISKMAMKQISAINTSNFEISGSIPSRVVSFPDKNKFQEPENEVDRQKFDLEPIPVLACNAINNQSQVLDLVFTDHPEIPEIVRDLQLARQENSNAKDQGFLSNLINRVGSIFKLENNSPELFAKDNVPIWVTLIEGYDKLTDSNLDVIRSYNKDGEIVALNIKGDKLNIYRNIMEE